jgi:phage shock protein A
MSGNMEDLMEILDDMQFFPEERLHDRAVRVLVGRHREEYDELTGRAAEEEIARLQGQVRDALSTIEKIRAANPDGVAVPALTETANALAAENDGLREEFRKMERKLARLEGTNVKLRKMIGELKDVDEGA